nr:MAG TPA: hypothetical protein [Caudoviricetes sp.]
MAARDETYQLSLLIFWLMFCGVVPMRRANSLPLILYSSRRRRTSLETCILYHLFPGGLLIVYRQSRFLCIAYNDLFNLSSCTFPIEIIC